MKKVENKNQKTSWGSIRQEPTTNNLVCQTAWKDNNLVLFMSTTHSLIKLDPKVIHNTPYPGVPRAKVGDEMIWVNRRRPKATSTSAQEARKAFGDAVRKWMIEPLVIDKYNHKMGQVDLADQLRSSYSGLRRTKKGWKCLWRFLYNTTLVNSYLLSGMVGRRTKGNSVKGQYEFRDQLVLQLLKLGQQVPRKRKDLDTGLKPVNSDPSVLHERTLRLKKQDCKGCKLLGVCRDSNKKRRVLGDISANQRFLNRARSTIYGCKVCDVPLCKEGLCWEAFHNQLL